MLFLLNSTKGLQLQTSQNEPLQSSCLLGSALGDSARHDTKQGKGAIGELDSFEVIRVGHMTN